MNATLSLLGTAMLILLGVAVVLAVIILVRLGKQLSRSISVADQADTASEPMQDRHGGP